VKLGIATVITDEGIRSKLLANTLSNSGFDSIHVTENSRIPASRSAPHPAGGELYWPYDAFVTLTAAALATSKLVIGAFAEVDG
jgi:alkanesulfonate monooxygenase SsuD/methylene tetrahydromethanopterin reductase-like flavin-dependent oxidoreductase (luciferase family)